MAVALAGGIAGNVGDLHSSAKNYSEKAMRRKINHQLSIRLSQAALGGYRLTGVAYQLAQPHTLPWDYFNIVRRRKVSARHQAKCSVPKDQRWSDRSQ